MTILKTRYNIILAEINMVSICILNEWYIQKKLQIAVSIIIFEIHNKQ